jgi:hypothetical protein
VERRGGKCVIRKKSFGDTLEQLATFFAESRAQLFLFLMRTGSLRAASKPQNTAICAQKILPDLGGILRSDAPR